MINKKNIISFIRRITGKLILLMAIGVVTVLLINISIVVKTSSYIHEDVSAVPEEQVIIILGAYVRGDNLSHVLKDRVEAGLELYDLGKSDKILLSGDHGQVEYDEVNSMRKYVLDDGRVSEEDVFLDHAGFDTYDSLYRAKEVFDVESAIIVTQDFHINRAVYIARELGIEAVGYSVSQDKYKTVLQAKWFARESLSRVKAFFDVVLKSEPTYLGEVVPITGDGRLSWDEFD